MATDRVSLPDFDEWWDCNKPQETEQRFREILPLAEEALDVALEAGEESFAVDAAHMIAIVIPLDQKLEWNLRAVEIAETASDEMARGWLGSLYNNIGYTYLEQNEYGSALKYFQKLLAFCEERDDDAFAAVARWFIVKTYRLMGEPEAALAGQLAILEQQDAAGEKSAYTYEELGECFLTLVEDGN